MTQRARDLENIFGNAWRLLARNGVMVVPGIVLAVIGAALEFLVTAVALGSYAIGGNGSPDALVAAQATIGIVVLVISIGISLVQMAFVTAMAGGAWRLGRTTLRDGWHAVTHRMLDILGGWTLLLVIGLCCAVLSTVTFLVPLGIYAVFFIYTMAAVIIGGRGPVSAITESARLALANVMPTIAVVALIVLISLVGAWAGVLTGRLSEFGGWLAAGVLQQIIVAYASLVVAGEYLKLTNQPTA